MINIRRAEPGDLSAITAIYNQAVLTTTASFDLEPKTMAEQQAWFGEHNEEFPIMVAKREGEVVGWASLSKWSDRCAYADAAEVSLYVREEARGQGVGRALLAAVLEAGKRGGLHTVISRIAEGNEVSIRLHESLGFQHIGVMREVGRKFGKLLDVYLMQIVFEKQHRRGRGKVRPHYEDDIS